MYHFWKKKGFHYGGYNSIPNKSLYNTSQISTNIKAIIIKDYRNILEDFKEVVIRGGFCNNGGFIQRKMFIVTDETFIERKGTERYFNGKVKKKSRKWYLKSDSDNRICISWKFIEESR